MGTIGFAGGQPDEPIPHPMDRYQRQVERVKQGGIDLVFIGDSLTHRWDSYPIFPDYSGRDVWDKYYYTRKSLNFGTIGERTGHIIWRLKNAPLEKLKPKVCVILTGTNNLAHGDKAEDIVRGIQCIVDIARENWPNTEIILMELFPRGERPNEPYRLEIDKINASLQEKYSKGRVKNVTILSIGSKYLNSDGTLNNAFFPDYLHLNKAGYQIWAESLEPLLQNLLGPLRNNY
ncbi:MAG: GDSL-type esterase/lipase family protein [Planctomycetia bacterium]|nr:GDSL-type esterase/lipase family protein [Planctomycetia bacterium]